MNDSLSVRKRRVLVANGYSASGYGRGNNAKNVYLIDGYYYAYHPEYAKQAYQELTGEFAGYVPCNAIVSPSSGRISFYQCNPNREGYDRHLPAKVR